MDYLAQAEHLIKDLGQSISILEQSPIGMCIGDLEGHLLIINDSFLDIVGYERAELVGTRFHAITHNEDLAKNIQNLNDLVGGKISSYTMEKRYLTKRKDEVATLMKVSVLSDSTNTNR